MLLDMVEQSFQPDGALLVSDEQLGAIYRISYSGGEAKKK